MQHITYTAALAKQAPYTNTIVKKEATQKIVLFAAILVCLALAVNI